MKFHDTYNTSTKIQGSLLILKFQQSKMPKSWSNFRNYVILILRCFYELKNLKTHINNKNENDTMYRLYFFMEYNSLNSNNQFPPVPSLSFEYYATFGEVCLKSVRFMLG